MLKTCGVRETVMLTGDSDAVGQKIAKRLGLDRAFTQLLPADKVEHVERLLEALHKRSNRASLPLWATALTTRRYWHAPM